MLSDLSFCQKNPLQHIVRTMFPCLVQLVPRQIIDMDALILVYRLLRVQFHNIAVTIQGDPDHPEAMFFSETVSPIEMR